MIRDADFQPTSKNKEMNSVDILIKQYNTTSETTPAGFTQPGLLFKCSVGYYSVTGWLETNLNGGDCDHSCTVIRTEGNDLRSSRKTVNGRLPSGPPPEEIARGRLYQNCKWK